MMGSWVPTDILLAYGDGNVGFLFFLLPSVKDFERGVRGKDFCFKISIA